MTSDVAALRPEYPHLDNLERILVRDPDFLNRGVSCTEKMHGFNVRVGRDSNDKLWFGSRSQDFDLDDDAAPGLQGFRDFARESLSYVPVGITVYGEWAGRGIQRGIDYGEKAFYLFSERVGGSPVMSSQVVLDQHMLHGVLTVPVIYEGGSSRLDVLDEIRQGESVVAPGQPIEGVVIAPLEPVFDQYGHQVIAKYKSSRFTEVAHAKRERVAVDTSRAEAFAEKYVNDNRFDHVLDLVIDANALVDQIDPLDVRWTGSVLKTMFVDVTREGIDDYDALDKADKNLVGKAVNKATLKILEQVRSEAARAAVFAGEADR